MKRSWVQIDGVLYERGKESQEPRSAGTMVMVDIPAYKSMITGEMIEGRKQHREHLKTHGCVEVGNDIPKDLTYKGIPDASPQQRKELIRAQVDAMSHAEFKKAVKMDVDRVKWNSRDR